MTYRLNRTIATPGSATYTSYEGTIEATTEKMKASLERLAQSLGSPYRIGKEDIAMLISLENWTEQYVPSDTLSRVLQALECDLGNELDEHASDTLYTMAGSLLEDQYYDDLMDFADRYVDELKDQLLEGDHA